MNTSRLFSGWRRVGLAAVILSFLLALAPGQGAAAPEPTYDYKVVFTGGGSYDFSFLGDEWEGPKGSMAGFQWGAEIPLVKKVLVKDLPPAPEEVTVNLADFNFFVSVYSTWYDLDSNTLYECKVDRFTSYPIRINIGRDPLNKGGIVGRVDFFPWFDVCLTDYLVELSDCPKPTFSISVEELANPYIVKEVQTSKYIGEEGLTYDIEWGGKLKFFRGQMTISPGINLLLLDD
jgi:hypothetical protein